MQDPRPGPPARVRQAVAADIPPMQRIRAAVRENRLVSMVIGADDYLREIERDGRGWVVETPADGIVGFATGNLRSGNIWALFVDPAHEGHGHGRALHDAMVAWLLLQGCPRLWLTTGADTRAARFYGTAGWQRVGGTPGDELRFEMAPAPVAGDGGMTQHTHTAEPAALTIGPATPRDAHAWAQMRSALWPQEPSAELRDEAAHWFAGDLPHLREVLLARTADGAIAGFAELNIRPYAEGCHGGRVGFLEGWYVVPAFRRRGAGAALVDAAMDWARAQRCTAFASDSLHDDLDARAAHLGSGFTEVESIRCWRRAL